MPASPAAANAHAEDAAPVTAVLLIAHGSRRPEANDDLRELARILRESGRYDVIEPSFLELAEPTIAAACRTCVDRGARRVLMLPFFLSAGRHVVADLVRVRGELSTSHPGVEFQLCPPLGLHPLMVDIVQDRLTQTLAESSGRA